MTTPTPPPAAGGRGEYAVDPLRGLVCLGVVVMHLYTGTIRDRLAAVFGPGVEFALVYVRPGVESFFVLAGFFLAHTLRPAAGEFLSVPVFLRRRFLRLAVPYWGVVALAYLDRAAVNALLGHDNYLPPPGHLLAIVFFVQDLVGVPDLIFFLWSMASLVQYYLLWAAVFWAVRRAYLWAGAADYAGRTRRVMVVVTGAVLVASAAAAGAHPATTWKLPGVAFYLAFGTLVYWAAHGQLRWGWVVAAAVPIAAVGVLDQDPRCYKALVCGLALRWLAGGHPLPDYWPVRALAYLGRRSYSVYLIHGWVGFRVLNLSNHLRAAGHLTDGAAVGLFAAAVAAGIGAGLVYYRVVEYPVYLAARRMTYRR